MGAISRPVFVTGATGSIGSRLAHRLSESGWFVRALIRDPAQLGKLRVTERIEIVQGDLLKPSSLHDLIGECSVVYHCAAKLIGSDWSRFRAINVDGTEALLAEARRVRIERFVHVSSIGVYGCTEAEDIDERCPWPADRYPYFVTKREAEQAAWNAADAVPITVARLGDVFGPDQRVWTTDFIEKINRGLLRPPTDHDSGFFNPLYIENAVDALLLMGHHPDAIQEAFNIVDGTPILFSEYIRRLTCMARKRTFAVSGILLKAAAFLLMALDRLRGHEATVKPGDVDYLLHKGTISGEKIRSTLGWRPAVSEKEAFASTEAWLRSKGYVK